MASSWIDGGEVVTAGGTHRIINPATGDAVAEYALATPADVDTAVTSARRALSGWATATPADRSAVLAKLAKLADANAKDLVAEEVSQTGKPVRLAEEFDVPGSIKTSTSSQGPPVTSRARPRRSTPPITPRAFGARPSASSLPSRHGTTRCRWRCGRCCPRSRPAARW